MLTIALLGAPRVERDGCPLQVDTRKAVALLVYLVVTAQHHRRDALAALFWPDADSARARAALRRTLSVLGKALDGRWLETGRETVGFDRRELDLDIDRFHALVQRSAAGPSPLPVLEEAAALHRGEFLAGFGLRDSPQFDDWAFYQADTLRRERADVLSRLVEELASAGQLTRAITMARQWVGLDELHEAAHRALIRLYALRGDRAAAVNSYRDCVRVLDRELGVRPLHETTALYEAVTADEPPAPQPEAPRLVKVGDHPFVGRDAEWRGLVDRHAGAARVGQVVALEGEVGIGKTRLAEELVTHAAALGARTVVARSHQGEEGLAYGLISEGLRAVARLGVEWRSAVPTFALAEAARLVPELAPEVRPAEPLGEDGAQARLLDGIAQTMAAALAGRPAGVLVCDDLQWADEASLDALTMLVRRVPELGLMLVLVWRTDRVPDGHRLRRLVAEMARRRVATSVVLRPLPPEAVTELVAAAGFSARELADRLHAETGGVPLLLVEYVTELVSGRLPAGPGEWPLPGGVRELLRLRFAELSETGRQTGTTAAVLGATFDADLLRLASGRSADETVAALEELTGLGFVAEPGGDGRYDFAHPRVRELVYEETSLARRRLLHRRAAEALGRQPGAQPGAVAQHYRLAGDDAAAAAQFALAGQRARDLHANIEALAHFDAALALGHLEVARLHAEVGDLHVLAGRYAPALASYERAAAHGADVERELGQVHHRLGRWELAERHFEAALATAGAPAQRARIQVDRSLNAHRRGAATAAAELAADALRLAEGAGDPRALAQAHNLLGILATSRGDHEGARAQLERSLVRAARLPSPSALIAAKNNLALACAAAGDLTRALELVAEALAACAAQGDRHRQAALHNNLADLYHAAGRDADAIPHLVAAARLFGEIDQPEDREPEIWKLVEW